MPGAGATLTSLDPELIRTSPPLTPVTVRIDRDDTITLPLVPLFLDPASTFIAPPIPDYEDPTT